MFVGKSGCSSVRTNTSKLLVFLVLFFVKLILPRLILLSCWSKNIINHIFDRGRWSVGLSKTFYLESWIVCCASYKFQAKRLYSNFVSHFFSEFLLADASGSFVFRSQLIESSKILIILSSFDISCRSRVNPIGGHWILAQHFRTYIVRLQRGL